MSNSIGRESLGVWLNGAYGWHNTYRVIDCAVREGFKLEVSDASFVDEYRHNPEGVVAEYALEISAEATEYLQSLVTDGLMFVWDAGELSLQEVEDDS